jgi:hypothetical protein
MSPLNSKFVYKGRVCLVTAESEGTLHLKYEKSGVLDWISRKQFLRVAYRIDDLPAIGQRWINCSSGELCSVEDISPNGNNVLLLWADDTESYWNMEAFRYTCRKYNYD